MKQMFSIALVLSIAALAVFGALAMTHANEHGHVGCLFAAAPAPACPATDVIAMFLFHAGILKSLLLAVASGIVFVALSLSCAIAAVHAHERAGSFFSYRRHTPPSLPEKLSFSRVPFMRWLSLRENSPSFA